MLETHNPYQFHVAARIQLPYATQVTLGVELQKLEDLMQAGEAVEQLATGRIDDCPGVLALTTSRLLWVPCQDGSAALWARSGILFVRPLLAPQGKNLWVQKATGGFAVTDILPDEAAAAILASF
jgi:hypothetical protein